MMVITGIASDGVLARAAAAGACVVLSKPFELSDFRIVVARLVRHGGLGDDGGIQE